MYNFGRGVIKTYTMQKLFERNQSQIIAMIN